MQYDADSSTTSNEETDSDLSTNPFKKPFKRYQTLPETSSSKIQNSSAFDQIRLFLKLTPQQRLVLKCSFAYILGCLFTFVPELNGLIGYNHVSSHLVATATVFFNPAKSLGGMVEAALYGWGYTLFALVICMGSMVSTDYFVDRNMSGIAHLISLGLWLTGSTFVIAFLKAHWNKPPVATGKYLSSVIYSVFIYLLLDSMISFKFVFHYYIYHCSARRFSKSR
jgi:hypothetical protein